jgi:ketosteroid isomerase-like protein
MSNSNIELVQSLYAAFKRGDIGAIIGALAPDVSWHTHGRPEDYPTLGPRKGPQAVQQFFATVAAEQTAVDFSPREIFGSGDRVCALGHYDWIVRKTGRKAGSDWVHVFTVRNGKITTFDEFTDTAQFAAAYR